MYLADDYDDDFCLVNRARETRAVHTSASPRRSKISLLVDSRNNEPDAVWCVGERESWGINGIPRRDRMVKASELFHIDAARSGAEFIFGALRRNCA